MPPAWSHPVPGHAPCLRCWCPASPPLQPHSRCSRTRKLVLALLASASSPLSLLTVITTTLSTSARGTHIRPEEKSGVFIRVGDLFILTSDLFDTPQSTSGQSPCLAPYSQAYSQIAPPWGQGIVSWRKHCSAMQRIHMFVDSATRKQHHFGLNN